MRGDSIAAFALSLFEKDYHPVRGLVTCVGPG